VRISILHLRVSQLHVESDQGSACLQAFEFSVSTNYSTACDARAHDIWSSSQKSCTGYAQLIDATGLTPTLLSRHSSSPTHPLHVVKKLMIILLLLVRPEPG
jgi:hypothetical protein